MRTLPARVRVVLGTVVSAAFVAGVVLAAPMTLPTVDRGLLSVTAAPEASTSILACSGPVLALGRDIEDVSALTPAAEQRVVVAATPGADEPEAADMVSADVPGGPPAASFSAAPVDRTRTDLAAAGSAVVDDPDLAGFAATACTPPAMESWLVAGSGLTGAADLVVLANPGDVAAQVDLTVFGVEGRSAPDAGAGILVPPGTQRVVPLAGLALGEQSPVVLVSATQAPVQATLQSSITRTLVPGGLDQTGATSAPALRQVIPAFRAVAGEESALDATVRVLAPSDHATADVAVTAVGADTPVFTAPDLDLAAGTPLEVELDPLPAGLYRVDIASDAPVVAGLWEASGVGPGSDFAWYPASEEIDVASLFAVAAGPAARLAVSGDPEADRTVTLTADAGAGDASEIEVPAGRTVTIDLRAGAVYRLDPGEGAVRANITYAGEGALAAYPVVPADAAAAPVVVRPR
ncbi:DUF5719 family protein [Microbacterium sp. 179-B 1A2 NHS]|uniref:DUF5719 family protein n=1 Tax=Microbacterium sp. 179-B 1A2 NHS TaxID=3142383 RepID=UPI00399FB195